MHLCFPLQHVRRSHGIFPLAPVCTATRLPGQIPAPPPLSVGFRFCSGPSRPRPDNLEHLLGKALGHVEVPPLQLGAVLAIRLVRQLGYGPAFLKSVNRAITVSKHVHLVWVTGLSNSRFIRPSESLLIVVFHGCGGSNWMLGYLVLVNAGENFHRNEDKQVSICRVV